MSTGHTSASFAATAGSSAAEGATSTSMNRATSGSSRDVALERPVAGAARQGRRSEGIPLVFRGSRTPPGGDRRPPISGERLREGPLGARRLRTGRSGRSGGRRSLPRMQRCVAHLDMDAFYVSVELMRRPELRGTPVVVAGTGPRAVVTTASYEARRFGVFSATPATRARRLCPEAVFIPPDFKAYTAMSKRVMDRVRAQVETVEVAGLDEAYLELTGLLSPRAAMRRLVSEIKADTGLNCSVGIGPNRLVAKVASDAEKPQGFVVLTREQACERFAGAPPRLLPGIGAKTAERLEELGIATIGQLAATPPETLAERFGGRLGPYLRARACFEDDRPVTSERIAVSESRETTFPTDIADRAEQAAVLRRLAGQLGEGLAKNDRRGRTIAIKVRLDDFTTVTRARTLAGPTNDPAVIGEVACALLEESAPPRRVRWLGVRVAASAEPVAEAGEGEPQLTLSL